MWTKQKGFTIVELLIVIVVIAILAAITIVAYNGIQDRAKNAAAQSAASQAAKKLIAYAVLNGDQYPASLADAAIQNTDNALQYTGGGTTFCLTATTQNKSYYINSSDTPSAKPGSCAGHGRDGVAAVTNLIMNPNAELSAGGFNRNNSSSTIGLSTDRAKNGTTSILVQGVDSVNGYNGVNRTIPVVAGKTYTFSAWVYLPSAYASSGVAATTNNAGTTVKQGNFITTTGAWAQTSVSFTPTTTGNATIYVITSVNQKPDIGATFYTDSWMFTEGTDLYNYADGASNGWTWNGTPNNSTSTGVPL